METTGVLDRITDGKYGTILAESIGREFVLKIEDLPEGAVEGTWFNLVIENSNLKSLTINHELTKNRKASIESTMARLRKRSGSKFKKK